MSGGMGPDGHPMLVTPENTSEFYAMQQALRQHHDGMHDALRIIAVALNQSLPKATSTRFDFGRVDLRLNARRVTRHLVHAASLNLAAGKAYRKSYVTFEQLFTQKGAHAGRPSFDVDK
jgi:hypothetical protein